MKKIILIVSILISASFVQGQILKKITDRVKNRADNKVNNKVDNTVDKTVDDATDIKDIKKGNDGKDTDANSSDTEASVKSNGSSGGIKAYSKYDFVPGEKIIVFEDFCTGSSGRFSR